MENQPQNHEEWERKLQELSPDGILESPLEGDDIVMYGQRLQGQINAAPLEAQYNRAEIAKKRIESHFSELYGSTIFLSSHHIIGIKRSEDGQTNTGVAFDYASAYGELQGTHILEVAGMVLVTLQLNEATVHIKDAQDGQIKSSEENITALAPICYITSAEWF